MIIKVQQGESKIGEINTFEDKEVGILVLKLLLDKVLNLQVFSSPETPRFEYERIQYIDLDATLEFIDPTQPFTLEVTP